jgi:UDP-N-acetylglucosamine--N-acetylmuramyl-(pentapeptide) pyrophosphoryl-undecaprenol N-acetylglucosamine transferase
VTYRVLITAGGSGGHVIPAQVVAEELASEHVTIQFAASGLLSNPFFDRSRWMYEDVPSAPPSLRKAFTSGPKIVQGMVCALRLLHKERPSLVVGFGSYHSVPVLAAATLCRVPMVLYTADAVPGRAVRCFAPFAQWTGCFFAEAATYLRGKTHVVGLPLRSSFDFNTTKEEGCRFFDLPPSRPVVLILGGSQGAKALNEVVPRSIPLLTPCPSVIHLCGYGGDIEAIAKVYEGAGVEARVRAFEPQMRYAYAAADAVIARSGASAIAEIEAFSKPALYIPYPHALDDHQRKNARLAAERGTAIVLDENEANSESMAASLQRLLASPIKTCEHAGSPSRSFGRKILKTLDEMSLCQKK